MTSRRTRARLVQRLEASGITDPRVLEAMMEIPRHIFLDEALAHRAYEDTSLPIGYSQTLSQPYIVARMTEIVLAHQPRRVLELGTGSGYQTAVLARLVDQVYSIERIKPLQDKARQRLSLLGIGNAHLRHGDGFAGWPDTAPFDAVIMTAAPDRVPETLLMQLNEGGMMVLPLGKEDDQQLTRVIRRGHGFDLEPIEPVRFVPFLTGVIR